MLVHSFGFHRGQFTVPVDVVRHNLSSQRSRLLTHHESIVSLSLGNECSIRNSRKRQRQVLISRIFGNWLRRRDLFCSKVASSRLGCARYKGQSRLVKA